MTTTAGDLELRIPKLRAGSFFPSLLERRRRIDQALFAVVMEAYLHGVSTRKVDDLVKALGADSGISKSEVSRICADLDEEVAAFRDRPLETTFPYVFLDATYCKARVDKRVVSQAVVIATGVAADGRREVLGFAVGDSEDGAFWTAFLRSLKARGLTGTQLVISDAHAGLKAAIGTVLLGASWQRCRVHFMRNVLARVPTGNSEMAAAAIRTVFAQPDAEHVRGQLAVIAAMLGRQFPAVEAMLQESKDELLAFTDFPPAHDKKVWSTNPLERLNKEIKRTRRDVTGSTVSALGRHCADATALPVCLCCRWAIRGEGASPPKEVWGHLCSQRDKCPEGGMHCREMFTGGCCTASSIVRPSTCALRASGKAQRLIERC